ncbi:unnamed protein product [Chrysodeixis includens]|uniref:Uncharacterized protein n=1 Tax=Chrysodeixis includens TaxID=689277 RepID=A0A9P0BKD6_CHRIL|nr:unnamed protein product [Chrysodeixis includens]
MPCQCAGLRMPKCNCKVLHTGYRCDETGNFVFLTESRSRSLCRVVGIGSKQTNIFVRFIEDFYDQCAGFNLRYCHVRGFIKHDNYLSHAAMDCVVLTCFLIANFIVFLTILAKTLVHLYFVLAVVLQWVKRSLWCKLTVDNDLMVFHRNLQHDYSPPLLNRFF